MKSTALVIVARFAVACSLTATGYWLIGYYSHTGGILYWLTFILSPGVWVAAAVAYIAESIGVAISELNSYCVAIVGNYAFIMVLTFLFRKAKSRRTS